MKFNSIIVTGMLVSAAIANNLNTEGLSGVNKTYTAYSIGAGSFNLGVSLKGEYGDKAVHKYRTVGTVEKINALLYGEDLFAGFGVTNWMDLAIDLPFYQDAIEGYDKNASGLGDLSASLKLMHPGMKTDALIRLAYIMRVSLPTGDFNSGYYVRDPQYVHVIDINHGPAFTSGGYNLNPVLAWTFDLTRLEIPKPVLFHLNFGMDALFGSTDQKNIPQENTAMQGGLAAEWLVAPEWSLFIDFYGKSRLRNLMTGPFLKIFAHDLLNIAVGTKNTFRSGLYASFVVEGSLSTQKNFTYWSQAPNGTTMTYGTQPTPTVGATLTVGFGGIGKNADPDFDGNPNATDKCPNDAEDYDGYQDEDGCPDPINVMAPPTSPDTVIVLKRDTVQIVHNDTIRISVPDTLQYRANQDPNQIFGFGKKTFPAITFKTASDQLNLSSNKNLNDIAQSMKNFPDVSLQIMGFTDNTGGDATNKLLSTKRAEAVVAYLVKQGISPMRLQPLGLGVETPVGNNNTAQGRLLNRRVEFKRWK